MQDEKLTKLETFLLKSGLSRRETAVAGQVCLGLTNKDVGRQLFVCEKTVKYHLTIIYKKLGVKSRTQMLVLCLPHMPPTQVTPIAIAEEDEGDEKNQLPFGAVV